MTVCLPVSQSDESMKLSVSVSHNGRVSAGPVLPQTGDTELRNCSSLTEPRAAVSCCAVSEFTSRRHLDYAVTWPRPL